MINKQYEINGTAYLIHDGELYVRYQEAQAAAESVPEVPASMRERARPITKKYKTGKSACGNCGQSGHNSKTCTEPKSTPAERTAQNKGSGKGHGIPTCKKLRRIRAPIELA